MLVVLAISMRSRRRELIERRGCATMLRLDLLDLLDGVRLVGFARELIRMDVVVLCKDPRG